MSQPAINELTDLGEYTRPTKIVGDARNGPFAMATARRGVISKAPASNTGNVRFNAQGHCDDAPGPGERVFIRCTNASEIRHDLHSNVESQVLIVTKFL